MSSEARAVPRSGASPAPPAPRIMGVVNVTPDSFSDGGRFLAADAAVAHGERLAREGAHLLDVGGESTRPGADPVSTAEELRRVLPVVRGLAASGSARISIDTSKAEVARAAVEAGATMVNDVTGGLGDPAMLDTVAELGVEYVAMHMRGTPRDMQQDPVYDDVVAEVTEFLAERLAASRAAGIDAERVLLDPGIGFGKTLEHNLELLRRLGELQALGRPLLVGVSRKSFIGAVTDRGNRRPPSERVGGTAAAVTACVLGGASVLRVHDVEIMAETVAVARALFFGLDVDAFAALPSRTLSSAPALHP